MSNIAILGHPTRCKEVIEILKMLGGKNVHDYECSVSDYAYIINKKGIIDWCIPHPNSSLIIFTLEEFLEKFPYKVGNKVQRKGATSCGSVFKIEKMHWDGEEVVYVIGNEDMVQCSLATHRLQPYKEETMEERDEKAVKHVYEKEVISFDIAQKDKYELDLQGKFHVVLREGKYYVERIKPKYPRTYEECAKELGYNQVMATDHILGYKGTLLSFFQQLLICRDAYWKIAGDHMGLGEPWKADWLNTEQDKFVLYTHNNVICSNRFVLGHNVLAFPTSEMRDIFYENFKDLIELCKELL